MLKKLQLKVILNQFHISNYTLYLLTYLFILGYITNYYEDTVADDIYKLTAYPTDDEMHLIIHEAHEQAIAFAQILEFVQYKDLFYGGTFNAYTLIYENDISEENLNQNDELEEIDDKADCESDEISKAADLINVYNISNLKEDDDDNLIIK